jgi:hypothetical protein
MVRAGGVLVALVLVGAAGALQQARERRFPIPPVADDTLYLTSGSALRRFTAGYNALAADVYWIRTIQYYGGTRLRAARGEASADGRRDYDLLYPLLDVTTSLDPRFDIAYRFGSHFLAEAPPGGPGQPELAIRLLEKGLAERADRWEYMQDIGFVHYWWRQDYTSAAQWFERASQVPGAPWWLKSLAASTLAEGGDRQSSRLMWQAILESAEIDWLRRDAERRLLQLRALDEIDAIEARVVAAERATGVRPRDLPSLFGGRVPVDPAGAPYELGGDGRVRVVPSSPLFPMPKEPKRRLEPAS